MFERVGFLDERFESYLEDVDFGLRCAEAGFGGLYVPEAVAYHQGSATLGRWHPDTVRRISRNQVLLVAKHYPPNWILRYGWPVFIAQALWGFIALRHGALLSYVAGKADGLRQFREARGKACARFPAIVEQSEKGASRNPGIDGVRSVLEAVLRFNMSRTGVVIVTYNSAGMIERCLESCGELPVVVVDNASRDATCELVRRHTFARLIANASNYGFAGAVNQGVAALDTQLVLLLNPDTELKTSIEKLETACLEAGTGLAAGQLTDEQGRPQQGFTLRRFPKRIDIDVRGAGHQPAGPGEFAEPLVSMYRSGPDSGGRSRATARGVPDVPARSVAAAGRF